MGTEMGMGTGRGRRMGQGIGREMVEAVAVLLLVATAGAAAAQQAADSEAAAGVTKAPTLGELAGSATGVETPGVSEGGPGEVLFDSIQYHVGGATSFTSQNHTDLPLPDMSGRFLESFAADDFAVDGFGWTIDQVEVKGHYFNGNGPAASVNVYFMGDAGGLPDTADLPAGAIAAYENLAFINNVPAEGDLVIPLPQPVALEPGTYWVAVQVNLDLAQAQWGFTAIETSLGSGQGVGHESAWMQNFPGFNLNCVEAWGTRITTCDLPGLFDPPHPDLGFILRGTRQAPTALEIPTMSTLGLALLSLLILGVAVWFLRRTA